MTNIKLTQEAYLCGHDGAFLQLINEDGTQSGEGLLNNWYEAAATDADGNDYQVYWEITGEINDEDAGNHCDWSTPYMVLDDNGSSVTAQIVC